MFSMCVELYSHHHYQIPERFDRYPKKPHTHSQSLLTPPSAWPLGTISLFLSAWIYLSQTFCIKGVIQYVALCYWLLSHSIMFSKFTHVVICISTSILFMASNWLYGSITFFVPVHQLMGIWVVSTLGASEYCWYEHSCATFCADMCFHFFLNIHLGVELLGHILTLCLIIWRTARLFPKMSAPFYIPTNNKYMMVLISALPYCLSFRL